MIMVLVSRGAMRRQPVITVRHAGVTRFIKDTPGPGSSVSCLSLHHWRGLRKYLFAYTTCCGNLQA